MSREKLEEKARKLLVNVIKRCYDKDDEKATRFEARVCIREFCLKIDDLALRTEANRMLAGMSFEEITKIYYQEEEIKMEKNENALYDNVIKKADGETVTVYLNADEDEALSFKKIKSFRFEDEVYVLLQNLDDKSSKYYRYINEPKDGKMVEKLVTVNDDKQVSLFKFLGY